MLFVFIIYNSSKNHIMFHIARPNWYISCISDSYPLIGRYILDSGITLDPTSDRQKIIKYPLIWSVSDDIQSRQLGFTDICLSQAQTTSLRPETRNTNKKMRAILGNRPGPRMPVPRKTCLKPKKQPNKCLFKAWSRPKRGPKTLTKICFYKKNIY